MAHRANAEKPVNTAPRAQAPALCKRLLQARAPAAGDPSVPPGKPVFSGTCAEMGSRASWRPCGIVTFPGTTEVWPSALYHEGSSISAWKSDAPGDRASFDPRTLPWGLLHCLCLGGEAWSSSPRPSAGIASRTGQQPPRAQEAGL